jgi:hypothetical protein
MVRIVNDSQQAQVAIVSALQCKWESQPKHTFNRRAAVDAQRKIECVTLFG